MTKQLNYLSGFKVEDKLVIPNTNQMWEHWKQRIANYTQERHPDKYFTQQHIEGKIIIKRTK